MDIGDTEATDGKLFCLWVQIVYFMYILKCKGTK